MAKYDLKDVEQFEQFIGEAKTTLELDNGRGDTAFMELEPLETRHMGKVIYLESNLPQPKLLNPHEVKAGRKPRYESQEEFRKRLVEDDYNSYGSLIEVLMLWIKQSYPDLPDAPLRKLVLNNSVELLDAFKEQHQKYNESTGKKEELKDFIKQKQNAKTEAEQKEVSTN